MIAVDEEAVPTDRIAIRDHEGKEWTCQSITGDAPFPLPVQKPVQVLVRGVVPGEKTVMINRRHNGMG